MRILILTSSFHPNKGGVETVVHDLCNGLVSLGHRIIVVTNRWPSTLPYVERIRGVLVVRLPMVSHHQLPQAPWLLMKWLFTFIFLSALTVWLRPEVMNIQCVGPNGYWGRLIQRIFKVPVVISTHGERTNDSSGFYSSHVNERLYRNLIEAAKVVVCVSKVSAAESIQQLSINAVSIQLIPNAISVRNLLPATTPRDVDVVFVGRLVFEKGVDTLINAIYLIKENFPTINVNIIGDGPVMNELQQLVDSLGLVHNVKFCGQMSREDVSTYLMKCKVLVLPSRRESFGLVLLEGANAGCAVVGASTGGIPSIIDHGDNGLLIEVDSVSQLAKNLSDLLSDAELRTQLISRFYLRLPEFDIDKFVLDYCDVFQTAKRL